MSYYFLYINNHFSILGGNDCGASVRSTVLIEALAHIGQVDIIYDSRCVCLWHSVNKQVNVIFTTTGTTMTTGITGATFYVTMWHKTGTTRLLLSTRIFFASSRKLIVILSTEQNQLVNSSTIRKLSTWINDFSTIRSIQVSLFCLPRINSESAE